MPYFAGLPMRMGVDCQLGKEGAESLQILSRKLRNALAAAVPKDGIDSRPNAAELQRILLQGQAVVMAGKSGPALRSGPRHARQELIAPNPAEWSQPEAVPALRQLLMAENRPLRLLLVEMLAQIPGQAAAKSLAQRALFDLSSDVREAAIRALQERPVEDYRAVLLEGFRYPWPAAADHAAEALAALNDRRAIPALVGLLRQDDPAAPFEDPATGKPVVRELVRINHNANCTLCHAQSTETTDPVRGLVPSFEQPLPGFTSSTQYYEGSSGPFVRADVTYLQQDFSVPQPVAQHGPWPVNQRFDYLVRTRRLSTVDTALESKAANMACEQREAVLFALRELTGQDFGTSALAWHNGLRQQDVAGRP
jgi:HEAT repeat protein